ncbi:ribulose-phosphate 3-epimerase [Patescibacteria group bacterium]|nr:ribulose-phosphate 3-epimerase [Patescibacteria group bacterium]MBU1673071.1 ribulose-phosphate 3-epimerase [Patescibacteria group bacterium]MBU1963677.1 ribulose-phosphate 3-epimerase [Patescibacteria group bacterium]
MPEVRPAILEANFEDVKKRVEEVKPYVKKIHLDVMDGEFVPNNTFTDPAQIAELGIEVVPHLMVKHPSLHLKKWDIPNVNEIIVHKEAIGNIDEVIKMAESIGKKLGIAVNPKTSSYDIKDDLDKFSMILVMGVEPGFSGQAFNGDVIEKIKYLRELKPDMNIAVDGGVDMAHKKQIVNAGANILAANSAIFKTDNIAQAIENLAK